MRDLSLKQAFDAKTKQYFFSKVLETLRLTVKSALENELIRENLKCYEGNKFKRTFTDEEIDVERAAYLENQVKKHKTEFSLTDSDLSDLIRVCEISAYSKAHRSMFYLYFPSMVAMSITIIIFMLGIQMKIFFKDGYDLHPVFLGILAIALPMATFMSTRDRSKTLSEIEVDKLLASTLKEIKGVK